MVIATSGRHVTETAMVVAWIVGVLLTMAITTLIAQKMSGIRVFWAACIVTVLSMMFLGILSFLGFP